MRPFEDDQDLKALLQGLPKQSPRPGYAERFWARAGEQPEPQTWLSLRWVRAAAVGAGLLAGLGLGMTSILSRSGPATLEELSAGLAPGSLAATFGIIGQGEQRHE